MRNKNFGNFEQNDENDEQKNEYEEVLYKNKNDEQKC
jgi:hypothetical protein